MPRLDSKRVYAPRAAPAPSRVQRLMRRGLAAFVAVVLLGVAGMAAAEWRAQLQDRFPAAATSQMTAECRAGGGSEEYCACTLQKVQNAYSYSRFRQLPADAARTLGQSFGRECAGQSHDFGPGFRRAFLSDCENEGIGPSRCTCMLDRLQERFTFSEYAELERQMLASGSPPPALAEALAPCDEPAT